MQTESPDSPGKGGSEEKNKKGDHLLLFYKQVFNETEDFVTNLLTKAYISMPILFTPHPSPLALEERKRVDS